MNTLNPSINCSLVQEAAASRAKVLADSLVSTSIEQDAPSSSIPSSKEHEHSPIITQENGIMPTEMELTLEQTQQGVSSEVSICIEGVRMKKTKNIRVNSYTMKMEIPLESTSNNLHGSGTCAILYESNLVTTGKNDGPIPHGFEAISRWWGRFPDSSLLPRSIPQAQTPTDKHKDIMKAQVQVQDPSLSDTILLS
ncbi:hypothetical protein Tco_1209773 [Tanacetum coccineum]